MKKTILALSIAAVSSMAFAQGEFVVFIDKTPTVQYVIANDNDVVDPEMPADSCQEWIEFANANKDLISRDWDMSIEGYPDITSCDQAVSTNINHDIEASRLASMPTSKMPFTNFNSFVMASDLIPASVVKALDLNTFGVSIHKKHLTDYGNIDVMYITIFSNNDTSNHVFDLPSRYDVANASVSLQFKNTSPINISLEGNVKSFSVSNDFGGEMNIVKMPSIKDELMLYGNINVLDSQASSKINGARSLSFTGAIDDLTFLSGASLRSNAEGSARIGLSVSATSLDGLEEVLGNTAFADQWTVTVEGENFGSNITDISALASIGKDRFSDKKMNFKVSANPLVDSPRDPNSPFCQWVVGDYNPIASDGWLQGSDGRTINLGSRANLEYAYQNCQPLPVNACDTQPEITKDQLKAMIANGDDVTGVCTRGITDFSLLFAQNSAFNQDISGWDVSNGTSFIGMFSDATSFNQDISDWDVSNGSDFSSMFNGATSFNQPLDNWVVENATSFSNMFRNASSFNSDISKWNVSKGTIFSSMFRNATSFNQNISGWNVAKGTNFNYMFSEATAFVQDISGWGINDSLKVFYFYENSGLTEDKVPEVCR